LDTFGSDSVFSFINFTREVRATTVFYRMNKARLVSFYVYRRQSRGRFRIKYKLGWFYIAIINMLPTNIFITSRMIQFDSIQFICDI